MMTAQTLLAWALLALAVLPPDVPGPVRPPVGMVYYAPGPVGRAVLVPERFARESIAVTSCESPGTGWEAVGDRGCSWGSFQVNLCAHGETMRTLGLDPTLESDRIRYAVTLWQQQGWKPWTCRP